MLAEQDEECALYAGAWRRSWTVNARPGTGLVNRIKSVC